ncbi:MAG: AMP-binding protein [Parvularculaceae bacterium]
MQNFTTSYWPATDDLPLLATTCGGVLRARALATPDAIALVEATPAPANRRRWTYAALYDDAQRVAGWLAEEFAPGTHIAVFGANRPEWVIAQFAIALSRLVMVTINPASKARELEYALRQSKSKAALYQRQYRGVDLGALLEIAAKDLAIAGDHKIAFDDLPALSPSTANRRLADADPRAIAMIQYTSGTTGAPKGAMLTHHSVTNNSRMMASIKGMNERTVNLAIPPLFHTGGCVGGVLASVQTGGALLLPESFDAELMVDLIEQERVTYAFAVPTMLIGMLRAQAARPRDVGTLTTIFSGGTVVPVEIVKQVESTFGATLIIGYGMTETSPAITHTRLDDTSIDKSETIGRPISQIEVKIAGDGSDAVAPIGTAGELLTRGFHLMAGYHDMPDETARTIDADGWLHTGDLCTMDERGYFRIAGRLKDMIIRGGENIYPREIEDVLYVHPAIAEVAVFAVADEYFGEIVGAAIIFKPDAAADRADLEAFAAGLLARHKIPAKWFTVPALPTTLSGKVQKFALTEMARTNATSLRRLD